jgi:hypothetical protein
MHNRTSPATPASTGAGRQVVANPSDGGTLRVATIERPPTAGREPGWVLDFADGSRDMRELLGGKGARTSLR